MELKLNERTNTIFVLTVIVLNFITLAINSIISGSEDDEMIIVMIIFSLLTIVYDIVASVAILKGRINRQLMLEGIYKMYRNSNVDGYYSKELLANLKIARLIISSGRLAY